MQTRLSKRQEQKTKNRLILNIIGIGILLILFVKFGIPFLLNFSLFLSSLNSSSSTQQSKGSSYVATPIIISSFTATNSAQIDLSGTAPAKTSVKLYSGDEFVDTVDASDKGTFTFSNVSLKDGQNTFKVKAKKDKNESDFSDPVVISYLSKPPSLTIDSPSDNQTFSKDDANITIKGKTDQDVKVTVNDFWAIVDDKGGYTYSIHLQGGDNQIKVDAVDSAGNKTEKTIKVTLSQ